MDIWLATALDKPTHMAASLDLAGTAQILVDAGLATIDGAVVVARDLARLDRIADLTTLKAIARLLLANRPPDWLRSAVVDERLATEFIPGSDLESLSWLGSHLEPIILEVHDRLYGPKNDEILKRLGNAGELMVMSALHELRQNPRHVALVSDRFGYDIEFAVGEMRYGREVKTVVPATAERLLVTRNEFEVARRMGCRWKIVQVTLSSQAVARGVATAADVIRIRELPSEALAKMSPADNAMFKWSDSAEFRPSPEMWMPSDLEIAADFSYNLSDI